MLKPVTVISGSSPRVAVETPSAQTQEPRPTQGERWRMVWLVAGAVALLLVGLVLFLNAGDDDTSSSPTPTPTASTPDALDPLAPTEPPDVTGRRTAQGVVFRWAAPDGAQDGDSWQWRRTDTGEEERTTDTSLRVPVDERVCLQVRLIRDSFASPWGNRCVD